MKNVYICVIRKNVHIDRVRTHLSIIGINHPGPHCGKVLLTLACGYIRAEKEMDVCPIMYAFALGNVCEVVTIGMTSITPRIHQSTTRKAVRGVG